MIVASVDWHREDLAEALLKRDIEPTDANIDALINSRRFKRTLEEGLVAAGWDIMDDIISSTWSFRVGDEVVYNPYGDGYTFAIKEKTNGRKGTYYTIKDIDSGKVIEGIIPNFIKPRAEE